MSLASRRRRQLVERHVTYWVEVSPHPFWLRELHDELDPWCGPVLIDAVVRRFMRRGVLRARPDGQLAPARHVLRR